MAGVEISNFGASSQIISKLNDAIMIIKQYESILKNAQAIVPFQISDSINPKISSLSTLIETIEKNCEYAVTGIKDNVSSYLSYENAEGNFNNYRHVRSISNANSFFWGYLSGTGTLPKRADSNFFANLKVGSYDAANDTYTISAGSTTYCYSPSVGRLRIIQNGKEVDRDYVGFYYPTGCTDLSNLNTVTFLPGDGEKVDAWKYVLESNEGVKKVINAPISSLLIIPQASRSSGNGFTTERYAVVHDYYFARAFMQQKPECKNSISGFSSGAISSFAVASTVGNNVYDTVVSVNGYMRTEDVTTQTAALKDKEIIVIEAAGDSLLQKSKNSLKFMHDNGFTNVTVVTSDKNFANQAKSYGFKVDYRNGDSKFKNHTSGWYIVQKSGVLEYLG